LPDGERAVLAGALVVVGVVAERAAGARPARRGVVVELVVSGGLERGIRVWSKS